MSRRRRGATGILVWFGSGGFVMLVGDGDDRSIDDALVRRRTTTWKEGRAKIMAGSIFILSSYLH